MNPKRLLHRSIFIYRLTPVSRRPQVDRIPATGTLRLVRGTVPTAVPVAGERLGIPYQNSSATCSPATPIPTTPDGEDPKRAFDSARRARQLKPLSTRIRPVHPSYFNPPGFSYLNPPAPAPPYRAPIQISYFNLQVRAHTG